MSTLITYGRGKGLVTGTGMRTQIGLIAEMIQSYEEEATPLQQKLEHLGKVLGTACLAICAVVLVYGLFRDTHLTDVFSIGFRSYWEAEKKDIVNLILTAVSLAIAAVPEGLPAIVTICLALGMQQMIKQQRADPQAARGRDARLRHGDLLRQDRHADAERDDRCAGMGRRQALQGDAAKATTRAGSSSWTASLRSAHRRATPPCCCRARCCATTPGWRKEATPQAAARGSMIGDPTEGAMVVAAAKGGFWRGDMEKTSAARAGDPVRFRPQAHDHDPPHDGRRVGSATTFAIRTSSPS